MVKVQIFKTLERWKTGRHAPVCEIPDAKLECTSGTETKEVHIRVRTTDYPITLNLSADETLNLISDLKYELNRIVEGV